MTAILKEPRLKFENCRSLHALPPHSDVDCGPVMRRSGDNIEAALLDEHRILRFAAHNRRIPCERLPRLNHGWVAGGDDAFTRLIARWAALMVIGPLITLIL